MSYSTYSQIGATGFWISFFLNALLAFAVYTLPFILYRFLKHPQPVPHKDATKYVIIYCVIAWVVLRALEYWLYGTFSAGGGVLLWGALGELALTKGYSQNRFSVEGADGVVKTVMLHAECQKYITSKLFDFSILSTDPHDAFLELVVRTISESGEDKIVYTDDPEIVRIANFVMIRTGLRFLAEQVNGTRPMDRRRSQKVLSLITDCLNSYRSQGYITQEKSETVLAKAGELMRKIH